MLATERPRMGSSRPPNGDMPFNYNYSDYNEFGFPDAPPPPPPVGESLLSHNESQLLQNFFEDVNTNQFNFNFGEGLNFNEHWLSNLPPTFMGSSTSFGQQPAQPYSSVSPDYLGLDTNNLNNVFQFGESPITPHTPITPIHHPQQQQQQQQHHQHHRPIPPQQHQQTPQQRHQSQFQPPSHPPPPPPAQQRIHQQYQDPLARPAHLQLSVTHSPHPLQTRNDHAAQEDVAAVLTSLGNGNQGGHLHPGHNTLQRPDSRPSPYRSPTEPVVSMSQQQQQQQQQHFALQRQASHPRLQAEDETSNLFTNMFFGGQNSRTQRQPDRTELQWGSDAAFDRAQGYIPSSHNETGEALEKERLEYIKCFSISKSAATTQPSSPNPGGEGMYSVNGHLAASNSTTEPESTLPPTKRRKSKAKVDVSGMTSSEPATFETKPPPPPPPKKRKSKTEAANGSSSNTVDGPAAASAMSSAVVPSETPKRKRPTAAAKAPRENLTESQKRENHIKSEQRRRGAIKEGFDGLTEIIPNLKAGGYSKSMMLGMAGDWLQKLIEGNRALAEHQQ